MTEPMAMTDEELAAVKGAVLAVVEAQRLSIPLGMKHE